MAADSKLITKADLAKAREVDFTLTFKESVTKLIEALGITRKIPKQSGTVLKTYKASGTLEDGKVAEGDTIPLSKYKTTAVTYKEIVLKKWRKAASAEAIIEKGFDQAVTQTSEAMLKDVQKGIRKDFFTFMATGKTKVSGVGLQKALAAGWGKLQVLFEDDTIDSVYFVNQEDIADYLGDAQITTQNAFGMKYIEDFLGLGTVFMNSSVPKGTYYATAKENVVLYYVPVNGADLDEAFEFTSDVTGYIGIHEGANYTNMTCEDTVVNGMELFAEKLDGVVVGTISPAVVAASEPAASEAAGK